MSQAFHLLQLQKIDTQIDQIKSRLGQIDQILQSNEALKQARSEHEMAVNRQKKAQQDLASAESAVAAQRIKVETAEAALYSGKIKVPKELQDLQNDIQSLKRRLSALEDEQLDTMVAIEQADKDLLHAAAKMTKVQGEVASQSASLVGEQSQLHRTQERLNTEREAALSQINPENITTYLKLREQKRGLAVCPVEDNACAGCGSTLRPEERQAARSPLMVVRCASCGRILYGG